MLVLVAGATGNIGQHLLDSLTKGGYQVRALARNSPKFPVRMLEKLKSFVCSGSYYDIDALDHECAGVDTVIPAYAGIPELQLEAQLLFVRAAERAYVARFIAASWNND